MTTPWRVALGRACLQAGVPGSVMALRIGDEETIATFGVADLETGAPVTARTIFRLGSMTKALTALLVMQQVEAGRIDLDAPVRSFLPELVLADEAAARVVTPRHLLSHRAGFFGDVLDGPSLGDDALEQYARAGGRLEQVTPPGEAFSYNNAAFALAGRLAERVGGGRWGDRLVSDLARPLGMTRTGVGWGDRLPDSDVAACHVPGPSGALAPVRGEIENPAMAPAGSSPWSSAADLLILGRLLSGRLKSEVVSARSLNAMRVWTPGPTSTFASAWGLGLQAYDHAGRLYGHDGAVAGGQSFLRVSADEDLTFGLFVNGGDGRFVFDTLFSRLESQLGRLLATPNPVWPEPGAPFEVKPLVGRYGVARYTVQVTAPSNTALDALFIPSAEAADFTKPVPVQMRRQLDDPSGELFVTLFAPNRLPTQQRFMAGPDGRRFVLFRGRLFPRTDDPMGPDGRGD